jgi:hypothetical protein
MEAVARLVQHLISRTHMLSGNADREPSISLLLILRQKKAFLVLARAFRHQPVPGVCKLSLQSMYGYVRDLIYRQSLQC